MAETTRERLDTLEQTVQGMLTQAAIFRKYLADGADTARVQEEYDGLRAMLATVFQELLTLARTLEGDYQDQRGHLNRNLRF